MNIEKLNAKFTLESIELDWKTWADPGCLFTEGGAKDVRTNLTTAKRIVPYGWRSLPGAKDVRTNVTSAKRIILRLGFVARRKRYAHERNKRKAHKSLRLGFVARR